MNQSTIRRMPAPHEAGRLTTSELRDTFLVTGLFSIAESHTVFTDLDRLVAGGIMPGQTALELANHHETGRAYFLEQREFGAINIGGPGVVHVDGKTMDVDSLACVYAGVGTKKLAFESKHFANPAKFFFLSCPAHAPFPAAVLKRDEVAPMACGNQAGASQRAIRKYIHAGGIRSCQLVMGYTELAEGNVWNTFPPHTHHRRTEIYFYFDLGDRVLAHFMGEPGATRHLFIHNDQAVLSPSWSIHCGCGVGNYKFIWGMAGENQTFDDMDPVKAGDLR